MSIQINNSTDGFNQIKVVDFRYSSPLKQESLATLFIRYQRIKIDTSGIVSWSDDPIKEIHIKNLDLELYQGVLAGELTPALAFIEVQKTIEYFINSKTSLEVSYFDEND